MSTVTGRAAETAAAHYLRSLGYKVISQNWRTRWCEIDLIVHKSGITYFVEAKYRGSDRQGNGLDYITASKLRQMYLAAEFWRASHPDGEYRVAAIELTDDPPRVTSCIDDIS